MAGVRNMVPDLEEEEAKAQRIQPRAQSVLCKPQISPAVCCLPDDAGTFEGENFKPVSLSYQCCARCQMCDSWVTQARPT